VSGVLGLTGASGYIGQTVMRAARACGWQVVAIGRHPVEGAQTWRFADLTIAPPDGLVDGLDALLHLAANTNGDDLSPASELSFARNLAAQAAGAGVPMVFISSQAAAANAPSDYGRTKFAIEQQVLPQGALVIRPGLVIGGREAGLFGLLVTLVRVSPLLPDLRPRPLVQPIHVDDLAAALLAACKRPDLSGRVLAAAGPPITFNDLLAGIARHRLRIQRRRIPVPLPLLRGALTLVAPFFGARLSPARLDSLIKLPLLDALPDLTMLGVVLRPLTNALDRRGRGTRRLLIESHVLTRAMIGTAPPFSLPRRYVRLLQTLGQDEALPLPPSLLSRPAWLAALDTPLRRQTAPPGGLAWRMNIVMRLAEAEPTLADLYLMVPNRAGWFMALRGFASAGMRELQTRLVGPLARQLAKGIL